MKEKLQTLFLFCIQGHCLPDHCRSWILSSLVMPSWLQSLCHTSPSVFAFTKNFSHLLVSPTPARPRLEHWLDFLWICYLLYKARSELGMSESKGQWERMPFVLAGLSLDGEPSCFHQTRRETSQDLSIWEKKIWKWHHFPPHFQTLPGGSAMATLVGSRAAGDLSPRGTATDTFQRWVYTCLPLVAPFPSFSVSLISDRSHRSSMGS